MYDHARWVAFTPFCEISKWWRCGGLSSGCVAHAFRVSGWLQTIMLLQALKLSKIASIFYRDCQTRCNGHILFAESAEQRAVVQTRVWRALHRCAQNGKRRWLDVLEFSGYQLQCDLSTIQQGWQDDGHTQRLVGSAHRSNKRGAHGEDSAHHASSWSKSSHFVWVRHPYNVPDHRLLP